MASNTSLLVAAIDFGTTYSGWAFSFKHEYQADPTKITGRQWTGGQLLSMKAPTTVLIKPDGKTLDSFGFEAENRYAELVSENSYKTWYYFRRFKMLLHGKTASDRNRNLENISLLRRYHLHAFDGNMNLKKCIVIETYHLQAFDRNMKLEDETQKSLPAKTVFSLVIRFLREDLLKTSGDRLANGHLREDEIMWILTVPAIWNDAAKQFMREAAIEAGIKNENFRIALEPETASIFCRLLPVEKMVDGGGMSSFKIGSKYMVLDAGGGTIDLTVHEVLPGGKLKEIHKASGGAWGGTQVDEAFKQFIISLVGSPVFCRFQTENKEDYLDLFRDFEIKKKEISPENDKKVTFHFPSSLKEIFQKATGEDICNVIKQSRYADKVILSRDKLRVDDSVMKSFFSGAIQNTVSHVQELMKDSKVRGISSILMVGGFSESKMLQGAIKSNFRDVRVIIPQEADQVVLKGAVVFGHSPFSIAERVCKYTYGISMIQPFDKRIHNVAKRREYKDGPRCIELFSKYVEVGQSIAVNDTTKELACVPVTEDQRTIDFDVYASTQRSPMYVTDEGCVQLGSVSVNILDIRVPRRERRVLVSMSFGGTEIEVTAKEQRTGRTTEVTVNFLG